MRWPLRLCLFVLILGTASAIVATIAVKHCACEQQSRASERSGPPRRVLTDTLATATVLQEDEEEHAEVPRSGFATSDEGASPQTSGLVYSSVDSLPRRPTPSEAVEAGKGCARQQLPAVTDAAKCA